MSRGKSTCKVLKEVRRKIADANGIPLEERECTHKGDCAGTCPYCEAEVRYLERELSKRKSLGKAVAVAGIAMVAVIPAVAQTPENATPSSDTVVIEYEFPVYAVGDVTYLTVVDDSIWHFPSSLGSLRSYMRKQLKKDSELRKWVRKKTDDLLRDKPQEAAFTIELNSSGKIEGLLIDMHREEADEYGKLLQIFMNMPPWELNPGAEKPEYHVRQRIPVQVLR